MNTIMLLSSFLLVIIGRRIENKIPGAHLLLCQHNWQGIELVVLIPTTKSESEVLTKISYHLSDEGAAVEEDWRVVEFGAFFMVFPFVGYPDVFFSSINEFLPQLFFELR